MPSATRSQGNLLYDTCIALTLTPPASIAANTTTYGTYTVPGLAPLMYISIQVQSAITNISITNAYVSAANTLQVGWGNETGGTVTSAPAVNCLVEVDVLENASLGFANLPSSLL